MKTLYIVDAVNFLFRSYYAIRGMSTPQGVPTGALYGFIRSIYKILHTYSPSHFIAVFDGPDNRFSRTALYKDYKTHRARMPDDLAVQLKEALLFCQIGGIPHLSVPQVEADDTMGSIAKWAAEKGAKVVICSSDKDICQLVSEQIVVLNPHKEDLLVDREKVKDLFGVTPEQIVDLIALVGDSSDNIPGVAGIGDKGARELLSTFHSLNNLFERLDTLPPKKKQQLETNREMAFLSQKLATLNLDVPFPKEDAFFKLKQPNYDELSAFFHQMHFLSLLKELPKETTPAPEVRILEDLNELKNCIDTLQKEKELCIDTETSGLDPLKAILVGIGIGTPQKSFYIPFNGKIPKATLLKSLRPLLTAPQIGWIGHHIKYDLHVFQQMGILLKTISFDTMLASQLLYPHIPQHNLDALSLSHLHHTKISITDLIGSGKAQKTFETVPIEQVARYCCEDVMCTLQLKALFEKTMNTEELTSIFETIEIPLISVLKRMEERGIFVDKILLEDLLATFTQKLSQLEIEIEAACGHKINLNSPKQLSTLLFETLQIPPPKKTKTGYSTASDVLESLYHTHPIIPLILSYRSLEKLRSTYTIALIEAISEKTGKIHCTFNQLGTATGRLSCQNPNLQNIPVRSQEGQAIRQAFRPQTSDRVFVSFDYSQIELRLLAHFSEDPALLKAFQNGEDIHAHTAALVFDTPLSEVTEKMRQAAKAVNFGILYGQQGFGLSQTLKIPLKEAQQFIASYFQRYTKVKDFLDQCIDQARKLGFAKTLIGRRRPIPDIHSSNSLLRSQAERLAINTPLQGTAADLIKLAMIQIDTLLQTKPHLGAILLQIHDELLLEVPIESIAEVSEEVKKIMEGVLTLKVPLLVHINVGKNWGEC